MDTLRVAKQLRTYGFDEHQAEGLAETLHDAIESKAATKEDLLEVKAELKQDISNLEIRLIEKISGLQTNLIYWGFALLGLFIAYMEFLFKK